MKIKDEILINIKGDKNLRSKLAKKMKKSEHTIYMWMWANSDNLTKMDALTIISLHTKIPVENLTRK